MPRTRVEAVEPAHSLLYAPTSLRVTRRESDLAQLQQKVEVYLDYNLNQRQGDAFDGSFRTRLMQLWGPPGTGKTSTLAAIVLGWLEEAWETDLPIIIGIGSSNYTAIDNLLSEVVELLYKREGVLKSSNPVRVVRVRSESAAVASHPDIEDIERGSAEGDALANDLYSPKVPLIVGGTWAQLGRLTGSEDRRASWFDLLLIDEASQVRVASAAAYYLLLKPDAHVILSGDDQQLGPINQFEMSDSAGGLFDSVFAYTRTLMKQQDIDPMALDENYRTNEEIARWPRARFYPQGYRAVGYQRRLELALPKATTAPPSGWPVGLPWSEHYIWLLDPSTPVCVITYPAGTATVSNPFEAQTVAALTYLYRKTLLESQFDQGLADFWRERLGVVTPHRAQMSAIKNVLTGVANLPVEPSPEVDTVDRFQGQERDLILASYAVADRDFVANEARFLLSSRRFNVTLTRARSKFIMLVSDAVLQHLPSDLDIAYDAAHLQLFVAEYCDSPDMERIVLPYMRNGSVTEVECRIRIKSLNHRE